MKLTPTKIAKIEGLAQDIVIQGYRYLNMKKVVPPIPVVDIARSLGFTIIIGEFGEKNLASILYLDQERIFVSSEFSSMQQKQIIAKQLGHYYLHKQGETTAIWKSEIYNIDLAEQENVDSIEADQFMASFLLPKDLVYRFNLNFRSASQIAYLFQVSNLVASFRLANMN